MTEKRRARRFALRLPVELLHVGSRPLHEQGETRNLSAHGVLFTTPAPLLAGERVEYAIWLGGEPGQTQVRVRCLGRVVRQERPRDAATPVFAVTLERYEFQRIEAASAAG